MLNRVLRMIVFLVANVSGLDLVAQMPVIDTVQRQFDTYRQNNLQEKVFVHTDKEGYMAGELCWFKIYDVDAYFHKPLDISKVAYAEVLDKNNKPVLQAKISMQKGFGNGSLILPVTLSSGNYKFRAYTSWMKNFSPDYFFEKSIAIINPKKIYEEDSKARVESYDVKFFPEGGNLVNGLQSKVAFRIVDQSGKGVGCTGVIINDKTDTILRISTLKFGIGNFIIVPKAGQSYKALLNLPNGKTVIQDLPVAFNDGWVMQLDEAGPGQVRIIVRSSAGSKDGSSVFLFAHTRNAIKLSNNGQLVKGAATFLVDKAKLGDGVSHFTIFNTERKPVCERLYFKYPEREFLADVKLDKSIYDLRKKINLQVSSLDKLGKAVPANMSMAVYLVDSLQGISDGDINNYLWLSSDLVGTIESPGYYFTNHGVGAEIATDNLMLTHGWRRFRWEDVTGNRKPVFEFIPEYAGHVVTGKISTNSTGLPAKDIECYFSVTGTQKQFRAAVSDNNGLVKFDLGDFYNDGEVIVQTNFRQDSGYSIELRKPFADKYSVSPLPEFSTSALQPVLLAKHNLSTQVQNVYAGNKQQLYYSPGIDTTAFYYKPGVSYLLDNFVRFTSMEEVLREYVAEVNVRKKNNAYYLYVFDKTLNYTYETDPLVLLDGLPIFDMNKLMLYDPLKIRKLEVVTRGYFLGNKPITGIINFQTYTGNLDGYELDPHAAVIDYEGLQMQREFYSPVYDTQEQVDNRLPDFRNLLYWNPGIRTNETGKQVIGFFTSELPGKYAVVVQGISDDGKTGSKVVFFEVQKPGQQAL
ncbi:hypothetical protein [Flavihumibacter fluvii]|uniref:hypothetical protein n=1 Tax=Flavihumibacter fluvii TaxID=2838157 RepID=UPI001BDDEE72|nr:hypothetical protein [Flavihumibacter fluvii]ULQ50735.1 hypothetical protein KJS93_11645 [Flavihumibacter fluvii]